MNPRPAEAVVYRHPYDCKSASRPLTPGQEPEHRFDVDGRPFPWHIHEEGPQFTRLMDDLYRIDVTIYGILRDGCVFPEDVICDRQYGPLMIGGREFPWTISAEGITYHRSLQEVPYVYLGFFAKSVDTDSGYRDLRQVNQEITDNFANVYRATDLLTPNEARKQFCGRRALEGLL